MKKRDGCDRFAGDAYRITPSEIADDVVRQVADCIRLQDPKQTAYLKERLAQIHGRYRRWRRQEADTPGRRELLDRLRSLQAAAARLAAELATLDEDVRFRIGLCHPLKDNDYSTKHFSRWQVVDQLTNDLQQFETAALRAVDGASKRGPSTDLSMYFLVQMLGQLYEDVTGEPVTHNPYDKTEYKGTPQSVAGRFILAAAKAIDSSIRSTAVNTAVGALGRGMTSEKLPIK